MRIITTREPETAWRAATAAGDSRSATNWRRSSMVSVMGVPALASAAS
jgi:hypothetical protein